MESSQATMSYNEKLESMTLPSSIKLLKNLGYDMTQFVNEWPTGRPVHTRSGLLEVPQIPKEPASFDLVDLKVEHVEDAVLPHTYMVTHKDNTWRLEFKVSMTEKDVRSVACLAARFAPPGSVVSMQADAHGAGNVYVGMIMSFGQESIPVNLVSGDIGCGLSIVPVVRDGEHLHANRVYDKDSFYSYVLATVRRSLKRGRAAETGESLSQNIEKAMAFYGTDELPAWLDEMRDILAQVDITYDTIHMSESECAGLTIEQAKTLQFIARYAQSLGSSGNHFLEMATDDYGYYWWVVHSGSRGLGARIYEVIAGACRLLTGGLEIATGPLATFYARMYDALNKFAKLNRLLCALAVSDALGFSTDASLLHTVMKASMIFEPAIRAVGHDAEAMLSLMSGLTHNGLKAYVNDETRQALFVLSKGAIAMTKRASASIVALRAGDGCFVWTLADASCPWYEERIQNAVAKVHSGYETVYNSPDIIYSGHGAGRAQATSKTAAASTFADVDAFYRETNVVGNIAPGVLGDNPRIAYNPVPTILAHLPLDIATTHSRLATCVTYKEGIVTWPKTHVEDCAEYIVSQWPDASDNKKMWMDLNLCIGSTHKEAILEFVKTRDDIYNTMKSTYETGTWWTKFTDEV